MFGTTVGFGAGFAAPGGVLNERKAGGKRAGKKKAGRKARAESAGPAGSPVNGPAAILKAMPVMAVVQPKYNCRLAPPRRGR
jgi:hypothetical protein